MAPGRSPSRLAGSLRAGVALLGLALVAALPGHALGKRTPAAAGLRGGTNAHPQGYLGIEFRDLSEEQTRSLHPPAVHGAEVVMVDHDGPAGKAGLRAHDIIVSLNGQAIAGAEALKHMIHDAGAGVQVALTVLRGGHSLTLNAQLADREEVLRSAIAHLSQAEPPSDRNSITPMAYGFDSRADADTATAAPVAAPTAPATPAPGSGLIGRIVHGSIYTGAVLDTMEPQLAGFFGAPQGAGLLVHSVEPGSPAAEAGLRAGDVILRADLFILHKSDDWTKRLHAAKGRPIMLSILRGRREMSLTLQQDLKHHSLVVWPALGPR